MYVYVCIIYVCMYVYKGLWTLVASGRPGTLKSCRGVGNYIFLDQLGLVNT